MDHDSQPPSGVDGGGASSFTVVTCRCSAAGRFTGVVEGVDLGDARAVFGS
jgi:hypothetical protein